MGIARGDNNGVSGLLTVLVDGVGDNPTYAVFVKSHNSVITFKSKSRRGRGSAGAPKVRITGLDGAGTVSGKLPPDGWPVPDHPEFCDGIITITMQTSIVPPATTPSDIYKVDIPVRITQQTIALSDGDDDVDPGEELFDTTLGWTMNGLPTWTCGDGTQVEIETPNPSDQELYEGLSKTYDANGLLTGAIQRIDSDQVGDDDLSECAKIVAIVAAAATPPMPNLKIITAGWTKPGEDGFGGEIILAWGLQDTKDNIETPANQWTQDANKIRDLRTLAQVWDVSVSAPTTPTPPTGLKLVTFRDGKQNDQKMVRFWTFGRTDSKDDILNPQIRTNTDPRNIDTNANVGVFYAPGSPPSDITPPSGLKMRHVDDAKVNDAVTNRQYQMAKTDTKDDILLPKNFVDLDPNGIGTRGGAADLNTVPTLPSGIGLKVRSTYTVKLNDDETLNVVAGAMNDTVDELFNAHASSSRSAQAPYRDMVPELESTGAGVGTTADSLWATFQSEANAFGLTVTQINPGKQLVVYEYVNPGILVEGFGQGGGRVVDAQLDGSGNVQLYVIRNLARGSGTRLIELSRYRTKKPLRRFIIRRLFNQSPPLPEFTSLEGEVNDDTFLGLGEGTCLYDGPVFTTNIALSGSLPMFMGYQFSADANGHFQIPPDLFTVSHLLTTSTTTARGWVLASALGLDTDIVQPDEGDFSVFVS